MIENFTFIIYDKPLIPQFEKSDGYCLYHSIKRTLIHFYEKRTDASENSQFAFINELGICCFMNGP